MNANQSQALALLGQGVSPEKVALTLGLSPSTVSGYLADTDFATEVTRLRFQTLTEQTSRDAKYDELEDLLLERMKGVLPFMTRPGEIITALVKINGAKRRGASNPDALSAPKAVVNINIPTIVLDRFSTNVHNQVITVGEQSLVTAQPTLLKQMIAKNATPNQITIGGPSESQA